MNEKLNNTKFKFKIQVQVRSFDLDSYGIVHNSVYLKYFEIARTEYIRQALGIDPGRFFNDFYFVIARNVCNYITPAKFDEILDVYARVSKIGNTSFEMEYLIEESKTKRTVATGETVIVLLNRETFKPEPIPETVKNLIFKFEEENVLVKESKT
ncbi:acyl-CoA thioester hydrolase [Candidatus Kryptobacter tengchongensis]|uniref:Acyl-CoA thioester hydrolase n=1 Tax=Kryptobacter tengchongensis TaxID=1643429 RepID=A0A656D345_KRYT1|nr:thioesterase family protein [Candidatus Kryptobacter tengchongensis]CUS98076.1 acyl-CoA thioester hydrolase [Candidatus Kryptobacter tengchongensis]CUU05718.1 acyl-CoA thioester hydrolase [Candidatus Kryptobacter tengchongensis]CUU10093.1 acyl-CoA thioester hydrolase [Candidatus Kryptobacter tengchongensis]